MNINAGTLPDLSMLDSSQRACGRFPKTRFDSRCFPKIECRRRDALLDARTPSLVSLFPHYTSLVLIYDPVKPRKLIRFFYHAASSINRQPIRYSFDSPVSPYFPRFLGQSSGETVNVRRFDPSLITLLETAFRSLVINEPHRRAFV